MTRKILLIRANDLRHNALASVFKKNGFILGEVIEKKNYYKNTVMSNSISLHFEARKKVESDYFYDLINEIKLEKNQKIECSDVNGYQVIAFAKNFDPELIITFGCSILKSPWLDLFEGRILGIHLGLSPYYRGAGTNFFPFVNNELGAVGYTLMKLNSGIDMGDVIHQSYATFKIEDDIHTIGTRLITKMFDDILKISNLQDIVSEFKLAIKQPNIKNSRIYRKLDFTEKALAQAQNNLMNKIVEGHISNIEIERIKFPLIRQIV